jgi:hypothetical protein
MKSWIIRALAAAFVSTAVAGVAMADPPPPHHHHHHHHHRHVPPPPPR